jgi:hypothetical protein
LRHGTARDRAAATFFGLFGLAALASALVTASLVLGAVSVVAFVAAAGALRSFPVDRNW